MSDINFEKNRARVIARVRAMINKYGLAVMFVGPSEAGDPAFHYTIGRARKGLPELLIAAPLRPDDGKTILNALHKMMPHALESGLLIKFDGALYPVRIVDADRDDVKENYTVLASFLNGGESRYRVQQVLLPDKQGRFPGDPLCQRPWSNQPILTKRVLLQ